MTTTAKSRTHGQTSLVRDADIDIQEVVADFDYFSGLKDMGFPRT